MQGQGWFGLGGQSNEFKPFHDTIPGYYLDTHGSVVVGFGVNAAGNGEPDPRTIYNPLNLKAALNSAVMVTDGRTPNPFAYAYSYKGGAITPGTEFARIETNIGTPSSAPTPTIPEIVNAAVDISWTDLPGDIFTLLAAKFGSVYLDIDAVDIDHDVEFAHVKAVAFSQNYHGSSAFAMYSAMQASDAALRKAAIRSKNASYIFQLAIPFIQSWVSAKIAEAELNQKAEIANAQIYLQRTAMLNANEQQHFVAMTDAWQADAAYNEAEARWNWDRIFEVNSLMAPTGTMPLQPAPPTRGQVALSQALGVGANTAMQIGGATGNPLLGGIAGLIAGSVAGFSQLV